MQLDVPLKIRDAIAPPIVPRASEDFDISELQPGLLLKGQVRRTVYVFERLAYYENSGEGWSNPGDAELCAMIRNVFEAMWSSLPMKPTGDETTPSRLS
jgi:hypothetical protein